jgi:hypothetical protein
MAIVVVVFEQSLPVGSYTIIVVDDNNNPVLNAITTGRIANVASFACILLGHLLSY